MSRTSSSILRAVGNLRQSWLVSTITTGIISISLFLVGGYLIILKNLDTVIAGLRTEVEITIYLRDGFPTADINALHDRLSGFTEVESVIFISKEDALGEFSRMLGEKTEFLEGLDDSPIPASLRVRPGTEYRNTDGVNGILAGIGDDPLIEDVHFGREWLGRLESLTGILNIGAVFLGGLLSLAAVFIISNTIKLTVLARRDELEIMRLVGATEMFIRTPFLIEGLIQGFIGSAISIGLLTAVHAFASSRLSAAVGEIVGLSHIQFLPWAAVAGILLGGMVIGGFGSMASVGRFSR